MVDDDPPLQRMLARTLAAEGFAVAVAADGGAALAAVERSLPDVIVLDVAMPGIDGLAVCRRLRAKGMTHADPDAHGARRGAPTASPGSRPAPTTTWSSRSRSRSWSRACARSTRRGAATDAPLLFADLALDLGDAHGDARRPRRSS